jgi:hypothetical protein
VALASRTESQNLAEILKYGIGTVKVPYYFDHNVEIEFFLWQFGLQNALFKS